MRRVAIPALILALLVPGAGCIPMAEVPRNRLHPGESYAEADAECQAWAVMAPMNHHRPDGLLMGIGDWWRRCMRGRGWITEVWTVSRSERSTP